MVDVGCGWNGGWQAHGIDHMVIPTRDYMFAPSFGDIRRGVEFINGRCGVDWVVEV